MNLSTLNNRMLYSMTGFGRSTQTINNKNITIEIRSLNGKQSDTNIRIPQEFRELEMNLRRLLRSELKRGKLDSYITVEYLSGESGMLINKPLVTSYIKELQKISKELGLTSEEGLISSVMRLPNVMIQDKSGLPKEEQAAILELMQKAIDQCMSFRLKEGTDLKEDIKKRIHLILEFRLEVDKLAPQRIESKRERIDKLMEEYATPDNVNQDRLEQEIVYYLEKLDITEEIVRLKSHCDHFLLLIENDDITKGRKLNFISQEIGRELNTIGAKANDADIQVYVVKMKDELEKIKEQMMNIL